MTGLLYSHGLMLGFTTGLWLAGSLKVYHLLMFTFATISLTILIGAILIRRLLQ